MLQVTFVTNPVVPNSNTSEVHLHICIISVNGQSIGMHVNESQSDMNAPLVLDHA